MKSLMDLIAEYGQARYEEGANWTDATLAQGDSSERDFWRKHDANQKKAERAFSQIRRLLVGGAE